MKVTEPTIPSEFEVQAYVWNELQKKGVNVRGEVKTIFSGRSTVRFDLAVFDDGNLTHIIEIKKSPIKHKHKWENTRQGFRYRQFGVPVFIIYGLEQAKQFVEDWK